MAVRRCPKRWPQCSEGSAWLLLRLFGAAVWLTLLCCVNVKQRVIDVNLARYEAGIDEELDWGVLWECGYQENAAR